jgi:nicotinate-nucleotide--dimethylbenzimidazole phosphoribosyltransferase
MIPITENTACIENIKTQSLARIASLAQPVGALGRLESLMLHIAQRVQSTEPNLTQPSCLLFAGDHGAVASGLSAWPQAITTHMVHTFLAGRAAASILAAQHHIALYVIDAGVNHTFSPESTTTNLQQGQLCHQKIAMGTRNYLDQAAMTEVEFELAFARGQQLVRNLQQRGCNTVLLGEMGIGNTSSASLLLHGLTGWAWSDCVGNGAGVVDMTQIETRQIETMQMTGLQRKQALVMQAWQRAGLPAYAQPMHDVVHVRKLICEFAGFEMVMLMGAIQAAVAEQMVVVIDGFIVTVALLCAEYLMPSLNNAQHDAPECQGWQLAPHCIFAHASAENAHQQLLQHLKVEPLLQMNMRLGEGSGALLAYPLLVSAVQLFNHMARLDELSDHALG